ncbi:hypothetical protein RQP46_004556 [Phenoliferia psychrophenolica]
MLRIASINALLSQLVSPQASPHTALVVDARSGAVVAFQSVPSQPPFPQASLPDRGDEERAQMYAAVATSTYDEERGPPGPVIPNGDKPVEPLWLESILGRFSILRIGGFLLILVGSDVSPWSVLDKKVRMSAEVLQPLATVA